MKEPIQDNGGPTRGHSAEAIGLDHMAGAIRRRDKEIERLRAEVAKQRWILLAESQPPDWGVYIGWDSTAFSLERVYWDNDDKAFFNSGKQMENVTHWRPIVPPS